MNKRGSWATRFGIYFAAIGSAFGLGSLWRFPYVVEENGGGAFVTLYFLLLILIGLPLLIGELLIGKVTRRGVLAGQKQLYAQAQSRDSNAKFRILLRIMPIIAVLSLFCCVLILGYYSVVSGWVLNFLLQFMGLLTHQTAEVDVIGNMARLQSSGMLQLLMATIHLVAILVIVAKGVEDGIEKWVGFIMPIFVGILAVLVYRALSMSSSVQALQYFLYPDFSKLQLSSLGAAIGQLCFTLSIGFATMATFGSYLGDNSVVPTTGFRVATIDATTALIAGLLIFPLIVDGASQSLGPELMFITVPQFLLNFEGGKVFGVFFFLCLYLAALGASLSILETLVSNICENSKLSRAKATVFAALASFVACIVPAFSSSTLSGVQISERGMLEFFDMILINWIVPILALLFSQIVVYEVSDKMKRDEFEGFDHSTKSIMYSHWHILMKWVVPPIILVALGMQFVALVN